MKKGQAYKPPKKIILGIAIGFGVFALLFWTWSLVSFFRAGGNVLAMKSPQFFFASLILGGIFAVTASILLFIYLTDKERYRRMVAKTVVCPSCDKRFSAEFVFCPKCGGKLKTKEEKGEE